MQTLQLHSQNSLAALIPASALTQFKLEGNKFTWQNISEK